MPFYVCVVPVCPVRAEASHRSEQVTQLLFGEACELLERTKDFVKIKVSFDGYEGWCQTSQLEESTNEKADQNDNKLAGDWVSQALFKGTQMNIPFGSQLPSAAMQQGFFNGNTFTYNGSFFNPAGNLVSKEAVTKLASTFLNTPYLWGGRSVFGIDCSGLTQMVYKCMNIALPRDAHQQAKQGEAIGFLQEAKCGDLAFFDNEAGNITHVGILLDSSTIIHSAGKVRADAMDNLGLINVETRKRTHNLRIIKRIADY